MQASARLGGRGARPRLPFPGGGPAPSRTLAAIAPSGADGVRLCLGAFPALGGPLILLCAGVGGEPDGCCDLRFWAGWGRVPPMIPTVAVELGSSLRPSGERVGGWILGRAKGSLSGSLALPGEAGSPPLPLGIVRVPSGPCFLPRELWAPAAGGPAELGRAKTGGLLGRSRLRGSVFRPFS